MRLVVTLSLAAAVAGAQQPPRLMLPPANASLAEEFSAINGIRELRDGRVLVTDPRERRVVVGDFVAGTATQVGKPGEGPLEYPRAQQIWPLSADTSAILDAPQRFTIFAGANLVATLAPDHPAVRATRPFVRGADTLGHILTALVVPPPPPSGGVQVDSVDLILVTRNTGRVDTVGKLQQMLPHIVGPKNAQGFYPFALPTINVAELAAISLDGWIAVARVKPYRVDWRRPDGSWLRGAPIPMVMIPFNRREQQSFIDRNPAPPGQAKQTPESITDWPEVVPPFGGNSPLFIAPDGRLLVTRARSADRLESRYDIVNRRGTVDGELIMAKGERVIGVGAKSIYIAFTDPDGLQFIRRHAWPPVPSK
jgi:hypothetical protein